LRRNNNSAKDKPKGLCVEVRNGDFNKALRIFKKKVQEAGIVQEVRERQQYIKPSEQRKKAKAAGRKRWLKKLEKLEGAEAPNSRKRRK
jgi:small subunit ribosomal protein S21